jgi:soluble lytic murein transglycosylase-like protein
MRRALLLLGLAAGGLLVARQAGAIAAPGGGGSPLADLAEGALGAVDDLSYSLSGYRFMSNWRDAMSKPENLPLVTAMHDAEARYGIPTDLVVRLAWQESRFKPDAYNASSGATGIMQIVPYWHPTVDARDPFASIDYGASYLAQLARQFSGWELALKAYNWGPGNLKAWLAGGPEAPAQPEETRNYSAQILADLAAIGSVIA